LFKRTQRTPIFVFFPECFLQGYSLRKEDAESLAEDKDGPSFQIISTIAEAMKMGIVYGYSEKCPEKKGVIYNSVQLIDKNGKRLINYRKLHLWGDEEKKIWTPGTEYGPVVEFASFKVALLICFDFEFPESCRIMYLNGAELVIAVAACCDLYVPRVFTPCRAAENLMFCIYANRVGKCSDTCNFGGNSHICGPNGEILGSLHQTNDDEITVVLRKDEPQYQDAKQNNPYMNDRRPELYIPITDTILNRL